VNVSGIPGALVNASVIEGPGSYSVLVSGLSMLIPALYEGQLTMSTLFGEQYVLSMSIFINGSAPSPVAVTSPINTGIVNVNEPSILIEWSASNTLSYEVEIATDDQFASIVETQFTASHALVLNYMLPLGDYFVRVRPVNDCGNGLWSDVSQFTVVDVSTNEMGAANKIKVYPNPAVERFIVSAERSLGFVRLMAVDGRLVWQQISNASQVEIDATNLTPGVYTLMSDAGNTLVVIR
jgi:Secretion system C-terminal sorting domain